MVPYIYIYVYKLQVYMYIGESGSYTYVAGFKDMEGTMAYFGRILQTRTCLADNVVLISRGPSSNCSFLQKSRRVWNLLISLLLSLFSAFLFLCFVFCFS